jgi:hypothetical protein
MKNFTLFFLIILPLLFGAKIQAQTIILHEDFTSLTAGGNTASTGTGAPDGTALTSISTTFTACSYAYSAGGAVKLGTGSNTGSITSAPLDLSVNGGAFKVKIKFKGWSSGSTTLNITPGTLTAQSITTTALMTGSFDEAEVSFTGGTANTSIVIATASSSKRAFIDEVTVYYGGSSLSNDATLSDIQVDGTSVSGFAASTLNYFVTLPATTTTIPTVTAATTESHATTSITQATSYSLGAAYINVTAQNGTTTKQYVVNLSKTAAEGEKGSKTNPYTVAEAKTYLYPTGTTTQYWVKGYIIGSAGTGSPFVVNTTDVDTNLALADASSETDVNNMIPVELPSGAVRTALGVLTTPANKGQLVEVLGSLVSYFTVTGVKSTSDYVLGSTTGINTPEAGSVKVYAASGKLYIVGVEAGTPVQIFTTSGSAYKTFVARGDNEIVSVPQGLYLVKVGKDSAKILVK